MDGVLDAEECELGGVDGFGGWRHGGFERDVLRVGVVGGIEGLRGFWREWWFGAVARAMTVVVGFGFGVAVPVGGFEAGDGAFGLGASTGGWVVGHGVSVS